MRDILRHVAVLACRARASPLWCALEDVALCENLRRDMTLSRLFHCLCLACAGLAISAPSAAITMGRLRGASVLGQPLDLTVSLQGTQSDEVADLCPAADVYFGESQVDASRVFVRLGNYDGATSIRLSVRKPVDEPIVTVYLKLGCQQQSTRKYVLLSEFASEVQPLLPASSGPTVGVIGPVRANAGGTNASGAEPELTLAPTNRPTKSKVRNDRVLPSGRSAPSSLVVNAEGGIPPKARGNASSKKEATSGRARLKLLPLDLTQDWEPTLQLTHELPALSGDVDTKKRAEAAELWHAVNASPEEILQETSKRMALEAELRGLIAVSRENQVGLSDLNAKLKAAQEGRLLNPVVYVLLILLVGCGAFVGYVMRNRPQAVGDGAPWWAGTEDGGRTGYSVQPDFGSGDNGDASQLGGASANVSISAGVGAPAHEGVDIPLSDSVFPSDAAVPSFPAKTGASMSARTTKPSDFEHSITGALRAINTQEMVDVRQQADFFLALGQHDEAVGVLSGALSHSTESNPHIYLDLIALLHKLSRKEEYEKVRLAFNALYTCRVPVYGEYTMSDYGLLDYPELCMPLVKLWPTPVAIDYIEQCLVREATDSLDSGIGIEAFKDLLLLHAVLVSVVTTSLLPIPSVQCPKRVLPPLRGTPSFANAHSFASVRGHGVDLDLSEGH